MAPKHCSDSAKWDQHNMILRTEHSRRAGRGHTRHHLIKKDRRRSNPSKFLKSSMSPHLREPSTVDCAMQNKQLLVELGNSLQAEAIDSDNPDPESCQDLLTRIGREVVEDTAVLRRAQIGVQRALKAIRRYKRTDGETWRECLQTGESLLKRWRSASTAATTTTTKTLPDVEEHKPSATVSGLPHRVAEYRSRLVRQKKELHKDPPVLPPVVGTLPTGRNNWSIGVSTRKQQ